MASIEPYDVNFCFPIHELENGRVKLTPFIPRLHAEAFFTAIERHPDMFTYIPFPPFPSLENFENWVETRIRQDPGLVLFAMIDKTKPASGVQSPDGELAGIVGLMGTTPLQLSTELGLLFTLPAFQRTHVTSTACALLLEWCFDELQMRRVQWRSDPQNVGSVKLAEKLGFKRESVSRWTRAVPQGPGKIEGLNIHASRKGDPLVEMMGIHTLGLAICWDDWERDGWNERVSSILRA